MNALRVIWFCIGFAASFAVGCALTADEAPSVIEDVRMWSLP